MGFTLNVPMDRGSGQPEFVAALEGAVLPVLDRYQPEFLLVSAGFDALMGDAISNISLEVDSYEVITSYLVQAAERHCNGRIVSVLEGGYDLPTLGPAVAAHIRAMLERG